MKRVRWNVSRIIGKNKTFYITILYYIIVLTLSISIIGIVISGSVLKNMHENISSANIEVLSQINHSLDELMFRVTDSFFTQIVLYNDNYHYIEKYNPRDNMPVVNNLIKDLNEYKDINEFIESIYIYKGEDDILISTDGCTLIDENNMVDSSVKNIYYASWIDKMKKYEWKDKLWLESAKVYKTYQIGKGNDYLFSYIRRLKNSSVSENEIIISANIYENSIYELIRSVNPEISNYIFIINNDGDIISCNDKQYLQKKIDNKVLDNLNMSCGYFVYDDNQTMFAAYYTSSYNGWKYLSIIPYDFAFKSLILIKNYIIIICIAAWMFFIILSILIAKKQYMPIKGIIDFIKGSISNANANTHINTHISNTNEYKIIKDTIKNYRFQINDLEAKVLDNANLIKNDLLCALITNTKVDIIEVLKKLEQYNIKFNYKDYRVATIDIVNCSNIGIENMEDIRNKIFELSNIHFKNCDMSVVNIWLNGILVFIINIPDERIDANYITDIFNTVCFDCFKTMGLELKVGISKKMEHCYSLPIMLSEAVEALKQRYIHCKKNVFLFDSVVIAYNLNSEDYSKEEFRKLINKGDIYGCYELVDKLCQMIIESNLSFSIAQQIFLNYISIIINDINKKKEDVVEMFGDNLNFTQQIYECKNFESMKSLFLSLVNTVLYNCKDGNELKYEGIVEKIRQYIVDNIDQEITIDKIADQIYLSTDYIRHIYKKSTGSTLTEYILMMKMNKAKDMLVDTKYNIEKIAKQLNYNTTHYFIKKFKECYGVTPKEYRTTRI